MTAPVVAALLGVAGLALAQDDLLVDPWREAVSPLLAPWPSPAPRGEPSIDRTQPRPVGVASFPLEEQAARPSVVPIGPPLRLANEPGRIVPLGSAMRAAEVVDPWAAPANPRPSSPTLRSHHIDWSWEINEIVDPWSKGRIAAITDPLIVDPWRE